MRISVLAIGAAILWPWESARACDPVDATLYVAPTDDGFVFVTRETMVRVSASGEVQQRREIGTEAGDVVLLSDRRTLLTIEATGESMDCHGSETEFVLFDTRSPARRRRIGRLPGHGVHQIAAAADGALVVRLSTYDYE